MRYALDTILYFFYLVRQSHAAQPRDLNRNTGTCWLRFIRSALTPVLIVPQISLSFPTKSPHR